MLIRPTKIRTAAAAAALCVLVLAATPALAQKSVRLSKAPAAFRTFYKQFAAAVNRGEGLAIAAHVHFPFKYGFDAGDEGVWTRRQFLKDFGKIFMPQPIVFKRKDPVFTTGDGLYTLTNTDDATHYTFARRGGKFKLISYIAEP